jgi:hypothetical protein
MDRNGTRKDPKQAAEEIAEALCLDVAEALGIEGVTSDPPLEAATKCTSGFFCGTYRCHPPFSCSTFSCTSGFALTKGDVAEAREEDNRIIVKA